MPLLSTFGAASARSFGGIGAAAAGAGLDIPEVFSTYLYDGTGSAQTITNGIDLSGEGGLVWIKSRNNAYYGNVFDTARGAGKYLFPPDTSAEATDTQRLSSFNSNGFSVGTNAGVNQSGDEVVSWTFRKAPKFFDVVTWIGNGVDGRAINHNLGSVPGMIIVKDYSNTGENWTVYHRGIDVNGDNAPETDGIYLNTTGAAGDESGFWNDTAPTSTQFTVGVNLNGSAGGGANYVAYLFAHNNSDGGFGPDADQDVIKCGSFTSDSSGIATVNLGFEPQWLMFKGTHAGSSWHMVDVMRGMSNGSNDAWLAANLGNAEGSYAIATPTPTGFVTDGTTIVDPSSTFIYMAIRRGPLAEPTSGTDVFAIDQENSSAPYYTSNFPVDMGFIRRKDNISSWYIYDRLRQGKELVIDTTAAEGTAGNAQFDYMDGFSAGAFASDAYSWMWKRAPSYFDAVAFTKTTSGAQNVSHNLGVVPEMMWIKVRNDTDNWTVYHKDLGNDKRLLLNGTDAATGSNSIFFNNTTPTASQFTIGSIAANSYNFIAYLFASVAGVSKVGSYTGNGSTQTIDCGFSSGARFVLIKRTDSSQHWILFDSTRGIVSGNDPSLKLSDTEAEYSGGDDIDPTSSGFIINNDTANGYQLSTSGASYIFYAIA